MKVTILEVEIDQISFNEAVNQIMEMASKTGHHYVVTANPEMLVEATWNEPFRQVINAANVVVPDGRGLTAMAESIKERGLQQKEGGTLWVIVKNLGKLIVAPKSFTVLPETVSGANLFLALCDRAAVDKLPVVLIGGARAEREGTATYLNKRLPNLNVITHEGAKDVNQAQLEEVASLLASMQAISNALVFVAFGHAKQELWIANHLDSLPNGVAMGVGGTFAYYSGVKLRAPKFMQQVGLEWLWRLTIEPKRWKRIFTAVVVFPWLVYRDAGK